MGQFIHANNEIIIIDNSGNQSIYDTTWWIANEEPAYVLPVGAILQYYRQGEIRAWHLAAGNAVSGSIPWADGDTYIGNKATYDADWLEYSLNLAQAKIYQIGLLDAYMATIEDNGLTYAGITYQSSATYYNRWKDEHDYALRTSNLLTSYYLTDISGNEIVMPDVATLTNIVNDMDEFYWELQQVRDNHKDSINALGTVSAVLAYDYTTGWAITPFDTGLTFYASYASSIDADYAGGSVTGTAFGGAAVAAGWLDLAHGDARYVSYDGTSNVDNQQVGSILLSVKPNYSGTPAADKVFICISKADTDSTNLIQLTHKITTGKLYLDIKDQADASIASIDLGVWSPVSGTSYKISIHYDVTAGVNWVKIDDTQIGVTDTSTGTRSVLIDLLRLGSGYNSGAAELSDFSIQLLHVSNQ